MNLTSKLNALFGKPSDTPARGENRSQQHRELLSTLDAITDNDSLKLQVAIDLDEGYRRREMQRLQAQGMEVPEYLTRPLLNESQLRIVEEMSQLTPQERTHWQKTLVPQALEDLRSDPADPIVRDVLSNELELERIYNEGIRLRGKALAPMVAFKERLTGLNSLQEAKSLLEKIMNNTVSGEMFTELCKEAHATWVQSEYAAGRDIGKKLPSWEDLSDSERLKDWEQVQTIARIFLQEMDENASG